MKGGWDFKGDKGAEVKMSNAKQNHLQVNLTKISLNPRKHV